MLVMGLTFIMVGCSTTSDRFSTPYAAGYRTPSPIQCVPYARDVSKLNIRGDAYTWWGQAANRYQRGNIPLPRAVLVLKNTSKMKHGHVAVVQRVIDSRHIDITHSNWGSDKYTRSMIYERMRVEDISPRNDWTMVRLWNVHTNAYGSPYPAFGFIYPSS